ncbi:MAG: hypothetical protein KC964_29720 [Candidatus Omnitrophica bacterium]|nr:hypothetical protein [Candidatus Omnitrophota bacterium]
MGETSQGSLLEGIDLKHLNREEAEKIIVEGPEAIIWTLLQLAAMAQANEMPPPSTPSSRIPPYLKGDSSKQGKKKSAEPNRDTAGPDERSRSSPTARKNTLWKNVPCAGAWSANRPKRASGSSRTFRKPNRKWSNTSSPLLL